MFKTHTLKKPTLSRLLTALILGSTAIAATGCAGYGRPQLTPVNQSLAEMAQHPVVANTVIQPPAEHRNEGSLWQPGAKQFFRDSRASRVGDIVTVIVEEQATATTAANTNTQQSGAANNTASSLLNVTGKLVSRGLDPTNLLTTSRDNSFQGQASSDRTDSLNAHIAAVVTQIMPNGYMAIQGSREVLMNYDKQILTLQGIIRPEDINADNTINSEKIAEARISYHGAGVIDETQDVPYGTRFLNKWLPF